MVSKSNRARQLERARAERRMARLAEEQRRKRRVRAGVGGALALVVLALGITWVLGGFDREAEPITLPTCTWTARQAVEGVEVTGLPPTDVPTSGLRELVLTTNLGEARNAVLVASADAVIAVGGSWGTLSEVAHAARRGSVPIAWLDGWVVHDAALGVVPGVTYVETPEAAVAHVLR